MSMSKRAYETSEGREKRMVEAAPDLFAALLAVLSQAAQGPVLERDACITQARAALAKVEGRK